MKVVVFVEYFPPRLGSDRRIFEIMKRLSSKHEIHFIVFPPFRALIERTDQSRGSVDRGSLDAKDNIVYEGIKGHFISISSKISLLWQRSLVLAYCLTSVFVFLKVAGIVKKIDPDVVVLNYPSPYTGLLGFLEAKLWRKPVVLDFNDLIAQYTTNLLGLRENSLKAKIPLIVQHFIVKTSSEVVVPTWFVRRYATSLKVPDERITLIPNGVDTQTFHPDETDCGKPEGARGRNDEKLCIYCGRLDGWAGMSIISKLAEIAKSKRMNVKFVLVGSGAEKMVPRENVVSLGEVPYEKVPSFLRLADVILIPFPDNEVSHAASPLKLLEGMAMQKPVIASRVSGVEDVVSDGENGFLADPDNIEEWMRKLETIMEFETSSAEVGLKARRTVEERFDWATLAIRFEEVLNASISKHQQVH